MEILETPLVNWKIHLELNWSKDCRMSTIADTTFKITNKKLIRLDCYFINQRRCKTGKNYEKKDLKDLFIGMSTKKKCNQ